MGVRERWNATEGDYENGASRIRRTRMAGNRKAWQSKGEVPDDKGDDDQGLTTGLGEDVTVRGISDAATGQIWIESDGAEKKLDVLDGEPKRTCFAIRDGNRRKRRRKRMNDNEEKGEKGEKGVKGQVK